MALKNKHIVVGVTGGIAAYKIPFLVRQLRQGGAEVKVVMTEAAREFVTPLTLATVSGNEVVTGTFPNAEAQSSYSETWHIDIGIWADAMVIAPATANTIAKLAGGYADNSVTTLALALRSPLIVSPAMDVDMWEHSTTQSNLSKLRELGCIVLPPESGELASGLVGIGRLPEIDKIIEEIDRVVSNAHRDLQGNKILVTAGPTHEPIDPVRFIGNHSSGKMGFAIANAAAQRGAEVTLIAGPVSLATPRHVRRIDVETGAQMLKAVSKELASSDALIMAAAVADFAPKIVAKNKLKKDQFGPSMSLTLTPSSDILKWVSEQNHGKKIVGFALETENDLANARQKLKKKKLDMIVLNNPKQEGGAFGSDTNVVTIISKSGKTAKLKKMSKFDVAHEILNRLAAIL